MLPQPHLHSRLKTWLQWIGQRQLPDETRIIEVLGFDASCIIDFLVCLQHIGIWTKWSIYCRHSLCLANMKSLICQWYLTELGSHLVNPLINLHVTGSNEIEITLWSTRLHLLKAWNSNMHQWFKSSFLQGMVCFLVSTWPLSTTNNDILSMRKKHRWKFNQIAKTKQSFYQNASQNAVCEILTIWFQLQSVKNWFSTQRLLLFGVQLCYSVKPATSGVSSATEMNLWLVWRLGDNIFTYMLRSGIMFLSSYAHQPLPSPWLVTVVACVHAMYHTATIYPIYGCGHWLAHRVVWWEIVMI